MQARASKITQWLIGLVLGLITLAIYLPSVHFDFLTYDDQQYVTENLHVRAGLTLNNLAWAFGFHAGNWHPLTWLSHMLDCQLYGLNPAGHHLINLSLHAANVVLLFLILARMTGALWPSAVVAAFFGWHPLHVESVAWVAERKDVLSAFFFLLTLGAYAKYVAQKSEIRNPKSEENPTIWYGLALLLFALGLMSKPMAVTLPFVLLLLDFWPLRRLQLPITYYRSLRSLLLEKLPFFALSLIACWLTVNAQSRADAVVPIAGLSISARIGHALISYMHYLGSIIWPRHLAVYYPYETTISAIQVIAAALVLLLISVVAIAYARKLPFLFVGWLWFLGTLVPVIGLVQVGEQAWADRYTYLPSIGLFLAVVWGVAGFSHKRAIASQGTPRPSTAAKDNPEGVAPNSRRGLIRWGTPVFVVVPLFSLLILTSLQLRYWKNTRTLFEHAAEATQKNYLAITLLGSLDAKEGKLDAAIERYKTALNWKPDYPEAHFFFGNALDQQGKIDMAIDEYRQALRFKPGQGQTHIFLGAALSKQGKYDEAASDYLAALKTNPESAVAHNNLAKVLQTLGKLDEAMNQYTEALKLDSTLAQAHNNLGVLLLTRGRTSEGVRELHEASRLNPGDPETEYNLARALNQNQQWRESADLLRNLLETKGNDAKVHCQFAIALVHMHKTREAMTHYASALLLQSDDPVALDGLSWILSTAENPAFRNGAEAVRMAERACDLTGNHDAQKLKTLAAAYAEIGRFNDAISKIHTAISIAPAGPNAELNDAQPMLESFKANKPWRDPELK